MNNKCIFRYPDRMRVLSETDGESGGEQQSHRRPFHYSGSQVRRPGACNINILTTNTFSDQHSHL